MKVHITRRYKTGSIAAMWYHAEGYIKWKKLYYLKNTLGSVLCGFINLLMNPLKRNGMMSS